jgi:DNA topoisomerase-1
MLATGRDARGRKQYRYHPRWRQVRDEAKYEDILLFAQRLPALRRQVAADVASSKLSKRKVIATVLRIMEQTRIRVGNDCYVANGSYGLTTLRDQHARISGGLVEFRFRGKGGRPYRASVRDRRLAAIVKRCRDIPGQRLFQYCDSRGEFRAVTSTDVNRYIRDSMGHPFGAKSFRTWAATVGAALLLERVEPSRAQRHAKRAIARAVSGVARELGNTPAICKKSYIHPAILEAYSSGLLRARFARSLRRARRRPRPLMRPEESAVLALFERLPRAPERAAA